MVSAHSAKNGHSTASSVLAANTNRRAPASNESHRPSVSAKGAGAPAASEPRRRTSWELTCHLVFREAPQHSAAPFFVISIV